MVEEKEELFSAKLSYSVDLISNKDSLLSIFNDHIDENRGEEILDLILDAQIEIDSTFAEGDYKLKFHVTDELSKQTKSMSIDFNLTK